MGCCQPPIGAAAADAAGIYMLSIEGRSFSPEMREAAGRCFVQVGLPYGGWGTFQGNHLATTEDYLRAAYHFTAMGGDYFYFAASYDIQKVLCLAVISRKFVAQSVPDLAMPPRPSRDV